MNHSKRLAIFALTALLAVALEGCAPKVGSDEWCTNLKAKPKGEWTLDEATDYAQHCLLK